MHPKHVLRKIHELYKSEFFLTLTTWKVDYTTTTILMYNTFLVIDNRITHITFLLSIASCHFSVMVLLRSHLYIMI